MESSRTFPNYLLIFSFNLIDFYKRIVLQLQVLWFRLSFTSDSGLRGIGIDSFFFNRTTISESAECTGRLNFAESLKVIGWQSQTWQGTKTLIWRFYKRSSRPSCSSNSEKSLPFFLNWRIRGLSSLFYVAHFTEAAKTINLEICQRKK